MRQPWSAPAMLALGATLLVACGRTVSPEQVALEYGRALYASDADALWRLISAADHRIKDEATFRRQQREFRGFAGEVMRQLAGYVTAAPVQTAVTGDRATVTLNFRLPDANAPAVSSLMLDWDEDRLAQLDAAERNRIRARLTELHRQGGLPIVEGEETLALVREAGAWKIFLNWASGVRVRFAAVADAGVPLQLAVTPAEIVLVPGDRVTVTVRATNPTRSDVTARVRHRTVPDTGSKHLALLLCPLFVPVSLDPGESREFRSEYLLLADAPEDLQALDVTYVFVPDREEHARLPTP